MRPRKIDYNQVIAEVDRLQKEQPLATITTIMRHLANKYGVTTQSIMHVYYGNKQTSN